MLTAVQASRVPQPPILVGDLKVDGETRTASFQDQALPPRRRSSTCCFPSHVIAGG